LGVSGPMLIDIEGAGEMRAFDPQIVDLNGHGGLDQVFEAQVGLLHVGLVIVGLEDINGGSARGAAGWVPHSLEAATGAPHFVAGYCGMFAPVSRGFARSERCSRRQCPR